MVEIVALSSSASPPVIGSTAGSVVSHRYHTPRSNVRSGNKLNQQNNHHHNNHHQNHHYQHHPSSSRTSGRGEMKFPSSHSGPVSPSYLRSTYNNLDLQTPQAFLTILVLLVTTFTLLKGYRYVESEMKRKKRERESVKAAEELLRLNVKHGVVDPDGTGKLGITATEKTGMGKGKVGKGEIKKNVPIPPSSTSSSAQPSPRNPDPQTIGQPQSSDPLTPPEPPQAEEQDESDSPDPGSLDSLKNAKNEARKAKKKIKRAAKLEMRMNSGDIEVLPENRQEEEEDRTAENEQGRDAGKGLDGDAGEKKEARVTEEARPEVVLSEEPETVVPPEEAREEINETINGTTGEPDVEVEAEAEAEARVEPETEPELVLSGQQEEKLTSPSSVIETPTISVNNVQTDDLATPSQEQLEIRRPSVALSESLSLFSAGSSHISNSAFPVSGNQSTDAQQQPVEKPKRKKKVKSGTAMGTRRAVPGAENWVKESHEEKERELREGLMKQLEEAKAASELAEDRANRLEKEQEALNTKLQKLESKVHKLSSSQHDIKERERQAVAEKEEAVRKANETQMMMHNYRKVEATLKHDLHVTRKERDKVWQDAQRKEADLRTQLQQMNASLAQAVHSAATFEAALRSTGRMPGTPSFAAPMPLLTTPVGPGHPHMYMNGGPRIALSTPPSPQPMLNSANSSTWVDRGFPTASPSRKRSPSEVLGLPMLHPMNNLATPVRESSLAWTVLKNKGENAASPIPSNGTEKSLDPNVVSTGTKSELVNGASDVKDVKEKENQPPPKSPASLNTSSSLPNGVTEKKRSTEAQRVEELEQVKELDTGSGQFSPKGDEEVPFFVFPSIHRNPEDVKAAMEVERGRRASLQRASSGLSMLPSSPSSSVSPGRNLDQRSAKLPGSDPEDLGLYDQSSGGSMTESRTSSSAFSVIDGLPAEKTKENGKYDGLDHSAKGPDLAQVNEITETPASAQV